MILFISKATGSEQVHVINADGTGERRVSAGPGNDTLAVWSPEGWNVGFTSDRDGNYEIYWVGSDGLLETRVTSAGDLDNNPAWAP